MTIKKILYSTIRPLGGLHLARFLSWRHPRILMYHRIGPDSDSAIDIDTFRRQVRLVKRYFNLTTTRELLESYDRGRPIHNAVALTFDDGYRDFYDYAMPILSEYKVPASLFITAGFVNGDLWLWPDQLRFCIDESAREVAEVTLGDKVIEIRRRDVVSWHKVADHCLTLPDVDKKAFIRDFAHSLGVSLPAAAPEEYRGLTWEQAREIASEGVEIGSHSMTHPIMSNLTESSLTYELNVSKGMIEREIGRAVSGFCYPNGQPLDFTPDIKNAVSSAGYDYALAAYPTRQPLVDRWAITRYAASRTDEAFEKSVFGMSFLGMLCL